MHWKARPQAQRQNHLRAGWGVDESYERWVDLKGDGVVEGAESEEHAANQSRKQQHQGKRAHYKVIEVLSQSQKKRRYNQKPTSRLSQPLITPKLKAKHVATQTATV